LLKLSIKIIGIIGFPTCGIRFESVFSAFSKERKFFDVLVK
jgi:predicted secreted protein